MYIQCSRKSMICIGSKCDIKFLALDTRHSLKHALLHSTTITMKQCNIPRHIVTCSLNFHHLMFFEVHLQKLTPFSIASRVTTSLTIYTIIIVNGNLLLTLVLGDTNLANAHMYSYPNKCIVLFAFTNVVSIVSISKLG